MCEYGLNRSMFNCKIEKLDFYFLDLFAYTGQWLAEHIQKILAQL